MKKITDPSIVIIIALIVILLISLSAFAIALTELVIGLFISSLIAKNDVERDNIINVVLCFWGIFLVLTLINYASITLNMSDWADHIWDNYNFNLPKKTQKNIKIIK